MTEGITEATDVQVDEVRADRVADGPRPDPRPTPPDRFVEWRDEDWSLPTPWLVEVRARLTRRQVVFGVAVALLCTVFGAYGLTRSPLLDLDRVQVSGAEHTSPDAIRAASGLQLHHAMTDLDLAAAREGVRALPWVGEVRVARRWPATVSIRVVERVAVASVETPDGILLVDRTGRVLERTAAPPPDLPRLIVTDPAAEPGTVQPAIGPLVSVVMQLTPELRAWISSLVVAPDGSPQLRLVDDVPVVFGDAVRITEKLIDLATVLTRVELDGVCRIDISVVHNPAIARIPNC